MSRKSPQTIRVVFLGGAKVGKTSIIQRIIGGDFKVHYTPTVYEIYTKTIYRHQRALNLEIIDTAGLYCCPPMMKLAISKADILIFMYSVTDPKSINAMNYLRTLVDEERGFIPFETPTAVVANKVDDSHDNLRLTFRNRVSTLHNDFLHLGTSFLATSAKFTYGLKDLLNFLKEEGESIARIRELPHLSTSIRWIDVDNPLEENEEVFEQEQSIKKQTGKDDSFLKRFFACTKPRTTSIATSCPRLPKVFSAGQLDRWKGARVTNCRIYVEFEFVKVMNSNRKLSFISRRRRQHVESLTHRRI